MQHRPEQHVTCEREVQSRAISGLSCNQRPSVTISGSQRQAPASEMPTS
jgi:hypothetical protein